MIVYIFLTIMNIRLFISILRIKKERYQNSKKFSLANNKIAFSLNKKKIHIMHNRIYNEISQIGFVKLLISLAVKCEFMHSIISLFNTVEHLQFGH